MISKARIRVSAPGIEPLFELLKFVPQGKFESEWRKPASAYKIRRGAQG